MLYVVGKYFGKLNICERLNIWHQIKNIPSDLLQSILSQACGIQLLGFQYKFLKICEQKLSFFPFILFLHDPSYLLIDSFEIIFVSWLYVFYPLQKMQALVSISALF